MRALRWHGVRDIRLEDVPTPQEPPPGCAVVAVTYCGVCGSDLAEYREGPKLIRLDPHPLTGRMPPLTLGHEFSGRIIRAADERRWPAGTRVTADACWRCATCEACVEGAYHRCRYGGSIGLHSDGAFAARVVVPEYALVAVPDSVPDEHAALTEPLAVALHALERGETRPGDDVLVLGFGPIGAASALLARSIGARPVVVEIDEARRARAEAIGFATVDAGEGLAKRVRQRLGGGGTHVVIESTGAATLLSEAVECARRGGRIVCVGLPTASSELSSSRLVLFERSVVGSLGYSHHLPRVLAMMAAGVVDPAPLISAIVPLSALPGVIAELAERPDARIKVLSDVAR
ncbi:MAG: (R,R)-butanediol dehydrogenase / meso-butanediol dehydrogenase / diacetyl reductase [Gaiellaceae bacterium]|jgi:(R,R)-butanediol dehydrogenase/meso-butanediol dehydrogenase/diacetyl reductase|nr:(R,R)-butanediol dehydrogenase / meso-butanediol dehydrogenase / diacetyl reductase [Gaiellaceae bacterium]